MKNILILILVLLAFTLPEGEAQTGFREGFIITSKGDTIYGEIESRSAKQNYQSCRFRKLNEVKEYLPSQLRGYRIPDDKFYVSTILDSVFVEVLISGELSLFKHADNFYLQKSEGDIHKLESKKVMVNENGIHRIKEESNWKGIVAFLTSDCEQSREAINKLEFNDKSLTIFVADYNKCKGADFIDYKGDKPWTKLEVGVAAGLARTSVILQKEFTNRYVEGMYHSADPFVGVTLVIYSPRLVKRLALQLEPYLLQTNISNAIIYQSGTSKGYHDTNLDFTTISLPWSLRYSLVDRKYNCYFQLGSGFDYHFKATANLRNEWVYYDEVTTNEGPLYPVNKNQPFLLGGIGVLRSFEKFQGAFTIKYQSASVLKDYFIRPAHIDRLSLSLTLFTK